MIGRCAFLTGIASLFLATGTAHAVPEKCAVVVKTTSIRIKPGSKHVQDVDVEPGAVLSLSTEPALYELFKGWKHVWKRYGSPSQGERDNGWIEDRHIKSTKCPYQ
jgi:hypothetical protein